MRSDTHPWAANCRAVAFPIPLAPPVIKRTLSLTRAECDRSFSSAILQISESDMVVVDDVIDAVPLIYPSTGPCRVRTCENDVHG